MVSFCGFKKKLSKLSLFLERSFSKLFIILKKALKVLLDSEESFHSSFRFQSELLKLFEFSRKLSKLFCFLKEAHKAVLGFVENFQSFQSSHVSFESSFGFWKELLKLSLILKEALKAFFISEESFQSSHWLEPNLLKAFFYLGSF